MHTRELNQALTDLYYAVLYLVMLSETQGPASCCPPMALVRALSNEIHPKALQRRSLEREHNYAHLRSQVEALFGTHEQLQTHFDSRHQWMPKVETWLKKQGAVRPSDINTGKAIPFVSRDAIKTALLPAYQKILDHLPEHPEDVLDAFLMRSLYDLAIQSKGQGFPAVKATTQLDALLKLSHAEQRSQARQSIGFPDFVKAHGAHFAP